MSVESGHNSAEAAYSEWIAAINRKDKVLIVLSAFKDLPTYAEMVQAAIEGLDSDIQAAFLELKIQVGVYAFKELGLTP